MLYRVRGTLVHCDGTSAAVECGGVAYLCQTSLGTISALGPLGGEVVLYTYMYVRENAVDLFGFARQGELSCFKMLISVSGVGPKAALSILSQMPPERVALCVASGDYKALTAAPGVGSKLAQRVVLELRDKVTNADAASGIAAQPVVSMGAGNLSEAVSALVVLGYSRSEAAAALVSQPQDNPVEELIKAGLKVLAKR
jgi:Holliday junction DNA helicase RuvA